MKNMEKITCWAKIEKIKDKEGKIIGENISHNHFSEGWSEEDYPLPVKEEYSNQKAWKDQKWQKKFAHLVDNKVVYEKPSNEV
jgi:hypothetical protein